MDKLVSTIVDSAGTDQDDSPAKSLINISHAIESISADGLEFSSPKKLSFSGNDRKDKSMELLQSLLKSEQEDSTTLNQRKKKKTHKKALPKQKASTVGLLSRPTMSSLRKQATF
jgi:hypothetical protein